MVESTYDPLPDERLAMPPDPRHVRLDSLRRGDTISREGQLWKVRSSHSAGAPGNPIWWEVRYGGGITRIRPSDPEYLIEGPRDTPVVLVQDAAEAATEAQWGDTDD